MAGLFDGTSLQRPVTCERCGLTHDRCACPRDRRTGRVLSTGDQPLRIRREKRGGKVVTVVDGFTPRSDRTDDLPALHKALKSKLAAGGSAPAPGATSLEFQGDHRDRLVEHFRGLGYQAKPAGG